MPFTLDPATVASDPHGISWGIHPITRRNGDIPGAGAFNTLEDMLLDLADTDYAGTKRAGFFSSKREAKAAAGTRGIKIVAQWSSSFILRDGVEAAILNFKAAYTYLKYLGVIRVTVSGQAGLVQDIRNVCILANKLVFVEKQWSVLTEDLNRLDDVAHTHSLKLVHHRHLGTIVQAKEEAVHLMELIDPARVFLLSDTGCVYVDDDDVVDLLEAIINHVKYAHFKDVRPEGMERSEVAERSFLDSFLTGMSTVPDDGTIDFTVPYRSFVDRGYPEWVLAEVKQDPAITNPLAYARKTHAYLEGILFET